MLSAVEGAGMLIVGGIIVLVVLGALVLWRLYKRRRDWFDRVDFLGASSFDWPVAARVRVCAMRLDLHVIGKALTRHDA